MFGGFEKKKEKENGKPINFIPGNLIVLSEFLVNGLTYYN